MTGISRRNISEETLDDLRISPYPPKQFWTQVRQDLSLQMLRVTYETWLAGSEALSVKDGVLTIQLETEYAKEWVETRLHHKIHRTVNWFSNTPLAVRYVADPDPPALRTRPVDTQRDPLVANPRRKPLARDGRRR